MFELCSVFVLSGRFTEQIENCKQLDEWGMKCKLLKLFGKGTLAFSYIRVAGEGVEPAGYGFGGDYWGVVERGGGLGFGG
jgi:hypothetical protein